MVFPFLVSILEVVRGAEGHTGEVLGAIVIPAAVLLMLFLMPIVGRWRLGHRFNIAFTIVLLLGIGWLTFASLRDDYVARRTDATEFSEIAQQVRLFGDDEAKMRAHFNDDQATIDEFLKLKLQYENYQKSSDYLAAVAQASREAGRVKQLAAEKQIPPTGACAVARDAKTQGEKLFTNKYGRVRLRMTVNAANCNHNCNQTGSASQWRRARHDRPDRAQQQRLGAHPAGGAPAAGRPARRHDPISRGLHRRLVSCAAGERTCARDSHAG